MCLKSLVNNQEDQSPKLNKYLKLKKEAVGELLKTREKIEDERKVANAAFDARLKKNTDQLLECGHELKEALPSSKVKTVKLKDDQIKSGLQRILSGKKDGMSIPAIMKELQITRGRFENFYENNTNFLGKRGEKRARVYFLL